MSSARRNSSLGRVSRTSIALLLALLLSVIAARGGESEARQSTSIATPAPTPTVVEDILARASARIANTEAVHFTLDIEGNTYIDDANTIQLLEAEGDLVRPDSVSTEFKIRVALPTLTIRLIKIGDRAWSTSPITGRWGEAPPEFSYDPGILFDTEDGIGPVMGQVDDPQRLDDEEVEGVEAYHVTGTVERATIDAITGHTMDGSPVAVDLWIDRATDDLIKVRLAEPPIEGEEEDEAATWTLVLSDHGKQVTIEPPD